MAFAYIRANFDVMWNEYPVHTVLPDGIKNYIADLKKQTPGSNPTPCCLQMSWALNAAGHTIPNNSFRRPNAVIDGRNHIGAVDELEMHLTAVYGMTEDIKADASGKARSQSEMKEFLRGRQGILVYRDNTPGVHTELWNTNTIKQKQGAPGGMSEDYIFSQPRILFWEVANTSNAPSQWNLPTWLRGWWVVVESGAGAARRDPQSYWYYFSDKGTVTYVKTQPKDLKLPPITVPLNSGRVNVSETADKVVIEWNPADGGATVETFNSKNKREMTGTSNRYEPLIARKL